MSVKITSDSTCDLSPQLLEAYGIVTIPLYIQMDGKTYRDGVDLTPTDVFRHVDAGGELCSTAAVNIADYEALFAEWSEKADAVIHFNIGSGFSSCCQNARIAAENFSNVTVIDSDNLSTGQGLLVLKAAMLAKEGKTAQEIVQTVEALRPRAECSFLLSRLDYMRKGGRCSAVAALGANLLQIRPSIEVADGKMHVSKKYRGTYEKCIGLYARDRLEGRELDRSFAFLTYTEGSDEAVLEKARQALRDYGGFETIYETTANVTISCHCGSNCLGVLFFRAN